MLFLDGQKSNGRLRHRVLKRNGFVVGSTPGAQDAILEMNNILLRWYCSSRLELQHEQWFSLLALKIALPLAPNLDKDRKAFKTI